MANPNGLAFAQVELLARLPRRSARPLVAPRRHARWWCPSEDGAETAGDAPIDALTVRFGGVVAVDGVTFDVRARRVVGLIGPNGAGKTTIIDAVTGLRAGADPAPPCASTARTCRD